MSSIQAFLDKKDYILIVANFKSTFKINGAFLPTTFLNESNGNYYYMANYNVDLSNPHIISDDDNNSCYLEVRYYVKDEDFDNDFYYDGDDLGSSYLSNKTTFKLWAPLAYNVKVKYFLNGNEIIIPLVRKDKGVYEVEVYEDLKNVEYIYIISINGNEYEVIDPYSYSLTSNSKRSVVIDLNDIVNKSEYQLRNLPSFNDYIFYEVSVRDFSMDGSLSENEKGKFNAFLKDDLVSKNNNPIGLNHIKNLGVTHIQLMPILDFATTDEDNIKDTYNWGYDPLCFNAIEGSYSSNPNNPLARINEAKEMINCIHNNNLRVTLDVVFNHTYSYENSIYNIITPRYFYLMDRYGNLSNGSFCGNDIDTTKKMVKKYFIDMCKRYINIYDIDGLRLDLMGILSIDFVNEIYKECLSLKPSFIVYGEGWNMPSMLPEHIKATLKNTSKLPRVPMFNDTFRDIVSGKASSEKDYEKGFINGNVDLAFEFLKAIRGSIETKCYFQNPQLSINYVECHDNATSFDKISIINKDATDEEKNRIQLCNLAATIFAQGIPFIHCGQEFNRSKHMNFNSYKSGDEINMIHWDNVDKYKKNIKAVQDFIKLRKEYQCFRLPNKKAILNSIDAKYVNNVMEILIAYSGEVILLLFNPTDKKQVVSLHSEYKLIANHYGYMDDDRYMQNFKIMPYSMMILTK